MCNASKCLALLAILSCTSCVGTSLAVEGFYDERVPDKLDLQPGLQLREVELKRGGVRLGLSHPDGFYKTSVHAFFETVDGEMPEGSARFIGGGAGFRLNGRRIEGLNEPDSRWLIPYRFEANIVETKGNKRPLPTLEYERFFYSEALFDLGVGVDLTPLLLSAGWSVQFLRGRVDSKVLGPGPVTSRRNTVDGLNHGPFVAAELLYADERPVRVELRIGGLDLQQIAFSAGVGF